jgi:guanine deaminase
MMNKYMRLAIKEAKQGLRKGHGGPFGCVIVKDGNVVAKRHNTVLIEKDATRHAEISAIQEASKKLKTFDLSGCEVYVTGRPCPMCRSALNWAKIKKVYYGCSYEDAKEIGFDEESANNEGYTEVQIDRDECWELFKDAEFNPY